MFFFWFLGLNIKPFVLAEEWLPERNIFRSVGETAVFQCHRPGGNTLGPGVTIF